MCPTCSANKPRSLLPREVADLLAFADCSRQPLRNRVIVLLSAKAGLRAGEIAGLTWDMVLDASGQIGNVIELRDRRGQEGQRSVDPDAPRTGRCPFRLAAGFDRDQGTWFARNAAAR